MVEQPKILLDADVARLLTQAEVIRTVEEVFAGVGRGRVRMAGDEPLWLDDGQNNVFIAMSAALDDMGVAGVKWVNLFLRQQEGYPSSHDNVIVLSDIRNGSLKAIVSADRITTMRTAGGHAVVAARHLARLDSRVLAVAGCGEEGRTGIRGFLEAFELKELRVTDRSAQAMERVRAEYGGRVTVTACRDVEEAVRGSDIVLMATTARTPLLKASWVRPGMTVIALSAFNDVDPALARSVDRWVLGYLPADTRHVLREESVLSWDFGPEDVDAELTRICAGVQKGRQSDEETILYSHRGMGALDVACAWSVYQKAMEQQRTEE